MTQHELIRLLIENKNQSYDVPELSKGNPADFITWGEGEFEEVYRQFCDTHEKQYPAVGFERTPDEGLLDGDGSDTSQKTQLDDAGFGSFGPM